jgi:hypothetical protein
VVAEVVVREEPDGGEKEEAKVGAHLELVILVAQALPVRSEQGAHVHLAQEEAHEEGARLEADVVDRLDLGLAARETLADT